MKSISIKLLFLLVCVVCVNSFLTAKGDGASKKAPKKEKCMIVKGKGKNLIGNTIHIHKEFVPTLKKIDSIAKQCNIKLSVKGSYEQIPNPTKTVKFTPANVGKHLKFVVMDKTGKTVVCNNICLAKEGEKIPEVKCLANGLRKESLRFSPHNEVGTVDDASDTKPGFNEIVQRLQEACKGVKL